MENNLDPDQLIVYTIRQATSVQNLSTCRNCMHGTYAPIKAEVWKYHDGLVQPTWSYLIQDKLEIIFTCPGTNTMRISYFD